MPSPLPLALWVPAVTALLAAAPASAQTRWETTEWEVQCTADARLDPVECDDREVVGVAAAARGQLQEASAWLDGLGFAGPTVQRTVNPRDPSALGRYLAWVGPDSLFSDGDLVCGYYSKSGGRSVIVITPEGPHTVTTRGRLVVDARHYVTVNDEPDDTATPTHELFHAVQGSYPFYDAREDADDWLVESTAQAVEAAWIHHRRGGSPLAPGGHAYVYGHRHYDDPLHRPHKPRGEADQLYATNHFWLGLGEILESDHRIQYLHAVMTHPPGAGFSLEAVDAALRRYEPTGLYYFYPEFIKRHVREREFFRRRRWKITLQPDAETSHSERVAPLATNAYLLVVPAVAPEGTGVEIRLPDDPALHLIVDDVRYDGEPVGVGNDRNVFRTALFAPDTFYVRIVNVAPAAADTEEAAYTVSFEAAPLDACDGQAMFAALSPRATGPAAREGLVWGLERAERATGHSTAEAQRQVREVLGEHLLDRSGGGGPIPSPDLREDRSYDLLEWEAYEAAAERVGLMPAAGGEIRIEGPGLLDGGVGCTEHLGWGRTADRAGPGEADPGALKARQAELQAQARRVEEAVRRGDAGAAADLAADIQGLILQGASGGPVAPSTVVEVYSPNALSWMAGALMPAMAYEHAGIGGWTPNTAAHLAIVLPNTPPEALRAGTTYDAVLRSSLPVVGAAMPATLVYATWDGSWTPLPTCSRESSPPTEALDFEGTQTMALFEGGARGEVVIEKIEDGTVRGRFALAGRGEVVVARQERTRCLDDGTLGGGRESSARRAGPIRVSGAFVAPARVEHPRPGRAAERTARVR